jgi:bisanhydrobacterioruberin hydratase
VRGNKIQIATFIALLFHGCGLIGILSGNELFIKATPLNLLLTWALLIWTQPQKNKGFFFFFLVAFGTGMAVEIIGINTGMLFGDYVYGTVLGAGIKGVPWLIGINWFTTVFCCAVLVRSWTNYLLAALGSKHIATGGWIIVVTRIADTALLASFFDWVMEPIAIKLGFWRWLGDGSIPFFNYVCWFGASLFIAVAFEKIPFRKDNQFAINLFLIQLMFFLLLRSFL